MRTTFYLEQSHRWPTAVHVGHIKWKMWLPKSVKTTQAQRSFFCLPSYKSGINLSLVNALLYLKPKWKKQQICTSSELEEASEMSTRKDEGELQTSILWRRNKAKIWCYHLEKKKTIPRISDQQKHTPLIISSKSIT